MPGKHGGVTHMSAIASTATTVPTRTVVAVALTWHGRVGLFRRSTAVAHDRGRWHCITGYVDPGQDPRAQALIEIHEETGLASVEIDDFRACGVLTLPDGSGDDWVVHIFSADTRQRRLTLNEEHDAHRWVSPNTVRRFENRVSWLDCVLQVAADPRT